MLGILILYLRPLDKSIKLKHFRLTRIRSTIKYWYQKRVFRKGEGEIPSQIPKDY